MSDVIDLNDVIGKMQEGRKYKIEFTRNGKARTSSGIYDGLNFDRLYLKSERGVVTPIPMKDIVGVLEFPQ